MSDGNGGPPAGPILQRLASIREEVMSHPETRASAEAVVQALLDELRDLDEGDQAPEWIAGLRLEGLPTLTVGELRGRLRTALEELAYRDRPA